MIQRIQTVYLALGAGALGALFFFDLLWESAAASSYPWFTPVALGLGGVAALTALVSIFLYGDRKKQRTLIVVAQVMTVAHLLVFYLGLYLADALHVTTAEGLDGGALAALLLPVFAYLFFLLARRGIDSDIALVRSMDRLRE